jgi:hypothetical protein
MPTLAVTATSWAAEGERLAQRLGDAVGHVRADRRLVDVVAQHHELVAAEPPDGVARTHRAAQPPCHLAEQLVADGVAEGVVDVLEAVEVEEQHRGAAPGCARAGRAPAASARPAARGSAGL